MKILKKSSRGVKPVITRKGFDKYVMYVGNRVRTSSIASRAIGTEIPKLTKTGYLIVQGDKPGMLVHPVKWDGDNVYARETGEYGTLEALNSTKNKKFSAEIVSEEELIEKAEVVNEVVEVKRLKDDETLQVALLNSSKHPYFAGLHFEDGELTPVNMEHEEDYNRKEVQFKVVSRSKVSAKKFLSFAR